MGAASGILPERLWLPRWDLVYRVAEDSPDGDYMSLGYSNIAGLAGIGQTWIVETTTGTTSGTITFPIYGGQYTNTQPYVIYPQQPYVIQPSPDEVRGKAALLLELEKRIDEKLEELRSMDREGLLKEMLIITEQQLDSLRSAPRYEAPKEIVVDKRQMELPLEMASDTLPF